MLARVSASWSAMLSATQVHRSALTAPTKAPHQSGNNAKPEKGLSLTPELLINSLLIYDFVLTMASFNLVPI